MKTNGISLNIGRTKDKRWKLSLGWMAVGKPRPQIDGEDCTLGLRLDLVWGPLVLPVARMYHWRFWKDDPIYSQQWNNGNQWFTIKLPFFIGPFVSAMFGKWSFGVPGFYLGCRTADLSNPIDWQLKLDWSKSDDDKAAWAWNDDGSPKEAWPVGKYKGLKTVEISAALRSDFQH